MTCLNNIHKNILAKKTTTNSILFLVIFSKMDDIAEEIRRYSRFGVDVCFRDLLSIMNDTRRPLCGQRVCKVLQK